MGYGWVSHKDNLAMEHPIDKRKPFPSICPYGCRQTSLRTVCHSGPLNADRDPEVDIVIGVYRWGWSCLPSRPRAQLVDSETALTMCLPRKRLPTSDLYVASIVSVNTMMQDRHLVRGKQCFCNGRIMRRTARSFLALDETPTPDRRGRLVARAR